MNLRNSELHVILDEGHLTYDELMDTYHVAKSVMKALGYPRAASSIPPNLDTLRYEGTKHLKVVLNFNGISLYTLTVRGGA